MVSLPPGWEAILCWIVIASAMSFGMFGVDKAAAVKGNRRIRESSLLLVALIGGVPGAKLGQRVFRHKTRKQPFARLLNLYLAANVVVWAVLISPALRQWLLSLAGLR